MTGAEPRDFTAYPGYDPDPCYHASDHDAADLCAQWRAAIAAEKATKEAHNANVVAIVVAIFSLATVIGLIVSIWQTFGALGEARRGNVLAMRENARSTRRAVEGAKETSRALEYARINAEASSELAKSFLAANRPRIFAATLQPTEENLRHLKLLATNAGQTPAIIEHVLFQIFEGDDRVGLAGTRSGGFFAIQAGGNKLIDSPVAEIGREPTWDREVTVKGSIIYADVHGFRRESGFSFVVCEHEGTMHINPEVSADAWYDREAN